MEKKIPPTEKVRQAIKEVLKTRLKIESQEELSVLALAELRKEEKSYTLSPTRAKRIALEIPEIEVKAKTRKKVGLLRIEKCPICESRIEEIRLRNLLNKPIVVGYRCISCGYQSDLEAFTPMKYLFIWKASR